jgi:hypothetical protein
MKTSIAVICVYGANLQMKQRLYFAVDLVYQTPEEHSTILTHISILIGFYLRSAAIADCSV